MAGPLRVAIIAPGEMGHGVGARLRARGATVATCLKGRGEQSRRRARAAGMQEAPDDDALVRAADIFLSIVPPAAAVDTGERVAAALRRTGARLLYVDCNAVAPATVEAVSRAVLSSGVRFVDAAVIGGPPTDGGTDPRFYVSGPDASAALVLRDYGLNITAMEGGLASASALKMSYGALTKGLTALATELLVAARQNQVADVLARELDASQPALRKWIDGLLPTMPAKAYRWVAEMEEVAKTFEACGLPGTPFRGAAEFYGFVADSPLGRPGPAEGTAKPTVADVVAGLSEACEHRARGFRSSRSR